MQHMSFVCVYFSLHSRFCFWFYKGRRWWPRPTRREGGKGNQREEGKNQRNFPRSRKAYILTLYSEEHISIGLLGFLEGNPGHPQAGTLHTLLGLTPHWIPLLFTFWMQMQLLNHNRKIQVGISVIQYQPLKNKFGGTSRYPLGMVLF